MKRRLLNLLTALSLLLCVAVVALWVRSYHGGAALIYNGGRQWGLASANPGYLVVGVSLDYFEPAAGFQFEPRAVIIEAPANSAHRYSAAGIGYVTWTAGLGATSRILTLPFWVLALTLALLPAAAAITSGRRRRAARRHIGLCPACGYDLRATPHKCPECGTVRAPRPSDGLTEWEASRAS